MYIDIVLSDRIRCAPPEIARPPDRRGKPHEARDDIRLSLDSLNSDDLGTQY